MKDPEGMISQAVAAPKSKFDYCIPGWGKIDPLSGHLRHRRAGYTVGGSLSLIPKTMGPRTLHQLLVLRENGLIVGHKGKREAGARPFKFVSMRIWNLARIASPSWTEIDGRQFFSIDNPEKLASAENAGLGVANFPTVDGVKTGIHSILKTA